MDKSISILVPAFNEEENLPNAIDDLLKVMKGYSDDYEIIIINDGSTDQTAIHANRYAKKYPCITVVHHHQNMGFGQSFRDGIASARKKWIVPFHADNDSSAASVREMMDKIGEADIINAYTVNGHIRPFFRRIISRLFILTVNTLFQLRFRYYTGYFIARKKDLLECSLQSKGLCIYPEAKIRLLSKKRTYIDVPSVHTGRKYGSSKAITFQTIWDTIKTLSMLFWEIRYSSSL